MITHDIQRFSTHLAAIYANVAKPVLDVMLYNYQLSRNVGAEGLVLLTVGVHASAVLCMSMASIFFRKHEFPLTVLVFPPPPPSARLDPSLWQVHGAFCTALREPAAHALATL